MNTRHWPMILVMLAIAILGTYLVYTERLVREVRAEAATHQRMYATVQRGLLSPPGTNEELIALTELQQMLQELGVPVVVVDPGGRPSAVQNLPFEADVRDPADHGRILEYARRLDLRNAPIRQEELGTVHFGSPPIIGRLRWVAWLQVAGALMLVLVGVVVVRGTLRAERERVWSAMARELAHQMGTPLTSLSGWLEILRLPSEERAPLASDPHIAEQIGSDVERLERVSRRFELIGKPPELEPVSAADVLGELESYLRPRLPRMGAGVTLRIRVPPGLPRVRANAVLLTWALENLVKNSLDALAGRGGRIRIFAQQAEDTVRFVVSDDGPGVDPLIRDHLFETGVSTKSAGWGVGLALAQRIVEQVHKGTIEHRARHGPGAVFEVRIPEASQDRGADIGA